MMVEAKVDIRKLQLLNDRIAQVTDALNQVRLSVHGLTHTGVIGQPFAGVPFGIPQQSFGFPQQLGYPSPLGVGFGLQHTGAYGPYGQAAMAYTPFTQGLVGTAPPWTGVFGWAPPFGGGLSHSPELTEQRVVEQRVNDPNRIVQTFPFCMAPLSAAAIW